MTSAKLDDIDCLHPDSRIEEWIDLGLMSCEPGLMSCEFRRKFSRRESLSEVGRSNESLGGSASPIATVVWQIAPYSRSPFSFSKDFIGDESSLDFDDNISMRFVYFADKNQNRSK
jgi:hypothetical protein